MNHILLADDINSVIGHIQPPNAITNITNQGGGGGLALVLSNIIQIIFVLGGIAAVFMLVFGAVQWILSAGDKDKVAQARSRITYAIIGIILLALSFVILGVIGQVTNFVFFKGQPLP